MSGFRYESESKKSVHILGKDYDVKEPTLEDQINYEKNLESAGSQGAAEVMFKYIESLGLPREACLKMPRHKIFELLTYLASSDKKK